MPTWGTRVAVGGAGVAVGWGLAVAVGGFAVAMAGFGVGASVTLATCWAAGFSGALVAVAWAVGAGAAATWGAGVGVAWPPPESAPMIESRMTTPTRPAQPRPTLPSKPRRFGAEAG